MLTLLSNADYIQFRELIQEEIDDQTEMLKNIRGHDDFVRLQGKVEGMELVNDFLEDEQIKKQKEEERKHKRQQRNPQQQEEQDE